MYKCKACQSSFETLSDEFLGEARGNTREYENEIFKIWKCPKCNSINTLGKMDFAKMYARYPLQARKLDFFAKEGYKNLMSRLLKLNISKENSILDFGCGGGVFLSYLKQVGFKNTEGYDPYEKDFSDTKALEKQYDVVIANDVIEHVEDPRRLIENCLRTLKKGGILYVGTADSEGLTDMKRLDGELMRLHLPYHRVILPLTQLRQLGVEQGLTELSYFHRSYMDTLVPFVNYRFLNEFNASLDHVLDRAFEPLKPTHFLTHPSLLFYAYFGYFFPCADEPAVIWRK